MALGKRAWLEDKEDTTSVLGFSFGTDFPSSRSIVVDDASNDDTRQLVKLFLRKVII